MRIILLSLLLSITFNIAYSQETNKAGTSAAQFLKIGVGAREIAMAGATAGTVSNVSSVYWNPAGLVGVNRMSVSADFTDWIADLQHNYFALVLPIGGNQVIGLSANVLDYGEMEVTSETQPKGTGEFFEAADMSIGLTYSAKLVDFFSFGITLKYITQNIYNESASTVAIDLGTRLNTGFSGIKIGMAFTNFGGKLKLEGRDLLRTYDPNPNNATNVGVKSYLEAESWELPTNFRVGIGWDIIGPYDAMTISNEHQLILAIDANHPNDAPENIAIGTEYTWRKLLSLRGGYHINDDIRRLVLGFGLNWSIPNSIRLGVDYAYANLVDFDGIHSFSFKIGF